MEKKKKNQHEFVRELFLPQSKVECKAYQFIRASKYTVIRQYQELFILMLVGMINITTQSLSPLKNQNNYFCKHVLNLIYLSIYLYFGQLFFCLNYFFFIFWLAQSQPKLSFLINGTSHIPFFFPSCLSRISIIEINACF